MCEKKEKVYYYIKQHFSDSNNWRDASFHVLLL